MAEEQIANNDVEQVAPAQAEVAQETTTHEQTEKLLKQSEVNKIVGGVKQDAYEKGRREEREALLAQQKRDAEIAAQNNGNMSPEQIREMINEEAERKVAIEKANRVAQEFIGKMQSGAQKHQDFDTVVGRLDIPNMPGQMIEWANSMDNTADVMYEMGKNPSKFASILTLTVTSPTLAREEFAKLSNSIKRNEDAIKENSAKVQEPLNSVKPSRAGTDNGTPQSVSDFRKMDWLRG